MFLLYRLGISKPIALQQYSYNAYISVMELASIASTSELTPQASPSRKRPRDSCIPPYVLPVLPKKPANLEDIMPLNNHHHSVYVNGLVSKLELAVAASASSQPTMESKTSAVSDDRTFSEILLNEHTNGALANASSSSTKDDYMVSFILVFSFLFVTFCTVAYVIFKFILHKSQLSRYDQQSSLAHQHILLIVNNAYRHYVSFVGFIKSSVRFDKIVISII